MLSRVRSRNQNGSKTPLNELFGEHTDSSSNQATALFTQAVGQGFPVGVASGCDDFNDLDGFRRLRQSAKLGHERAGFGTNSTDVPNATNTNQITLPLNTTNGVVFFRMVFP